MRSDFLLMNCAKLRPPVGRAGSKNPVELCMFLGETIPKMALGDTHTHDDVDQLYQPRPVRGVPLKQYGRQAERE